MPLAAEEFFPRVVAARPALFGCLDGLSVQHRRRLLCRLVRLLADPVAELVVQPLPRPIVLSLAELVEDNPVRRQVVWQRPPGAAVASDVQDRVDDFTLRVLRWPAGGRVAWNPGLLSVATGGP